jgi:hypothetical protein
MLGDFDADELLAVLDSFEYDESDEDLTDEECGE